MISGPVGPSSQAHSCSPPKADDNSIQNPYIVPIGPTARRFREFNMPAALLSRDEVVERLMGVVRLRGYDGASLAELSKAAGLGRSSLYHHFPEGKDDMVRAVLAHLGEELRQVVFEPLRQAGPAQKRVDNMVKTLDEYYHSGRESCLLGNLVLGTSRSRFRPQLRAIFDEWIDALAMPLIDAGFTKSVARKRAEDGVIRIEGALILAGGMDDISLFVRTLKQLPAELLAPVRTKR